MHEVAHSVTHQELHRGFLVLIPLFPLIGAAIIGLLQGILPRKLTGWLASFAVFASFLTSLVALKHLKTAYTGRGDILVQQVLTWFESSDTRIGLDLMVDPLTAVMLMVVTFVGFLIHVYSVGYMDHEEESNRYFAYLNLFVCFMLLLVMAKNLVMLFVGWEGVGACSYLLIGFYFREWDKADAGKKAFVVNRIGDMFFVLGMLTLALVMMNVQAKDKFDFVVLEASRTFISNAGHLTVQGMEWVSKYNVIPLICLLLFIGATGKSAQIPLYTWLPDAMAGPTPVSALIHAATMVTAGVYMICRLDFLFLEAGRVNTIIAWVGMLTALFAGIIAVKQNDIKKVLAYSTVSQLGYMFASCGVGAYSFAVFHLFTHAFFKALLFLGSGSVIHAMHGEQDIMKMGGLAKHLPHTNRVFLIGSLALAGFPPLAGWFSKDGILWATYQSDRGGHTLLFLLGTLTACLTAFYVTRLYCLVFLGESRVKDESHVHESPPTMTIPLYILAAGSLLAGFLNMPGFVPRLNDWFSHKLEGSFPLEAHLHVRPFMELLLMVGTTALGLAVIFFAHQLYTSRDAFSNLDSMERTWPSWMVGLVSNKFYVDEIYHYTVVVPTMFLARVFKNNVDEGAIDGLLVDGTAHAFRSMGKGLVTFQNGDVQRYLIGITLGLLGILMYVTYRLG